MITYKLIAYSGQFLEYSGIPRSGTRGLVGPSGIESRLMMLLLDDIKSGLDEETKRV